MSAFIHDTALSRSEGVAAVMEEFALAGFARYVLLLETLARQNSPVAMSYDAWTVQLHGHGDDESIREFLAFCQARDLLTVDDNGETLSIQSRVLERADAAAPTVAPSDDTLYTRPEQWAAWFKSDLSYPPREAERPENKRYFARWCASRVTVGDMSAAVQEAIAQGTGVTTPALHRHLQALRTKRLQEVDECY